MPSIPKEALEFAGPRDYGSGGGLRIALTPEQEEIIKSANDGARELLQIIHRRGLATHALKESDRPVYIAETREHELAWTGVNDGIRRVIGIKVEPDLVSVQGTARAIEFVEKDGAREYKHRTLPAVGFGVVLRNFDRYTAAVLGGETNLLYDTLLGIGVNDLTITTAEKAVPGRSPIVISVVTSDEVKPFRD